VTPGDRIPKLVKGTIDLECGSTTITFGRMEQVAFSHMIFVDGGGLLATTASGIATVRDLAGKRVGVVPNTTTEKALAGALASASVQATVVTVNEHGDGLRGLEEGRLDAYASDRILLAGLLKTARNPEKLALSAELFSYEPYGLMLRRGDNAFQANVNRTLSHLYRSGGLVAIYERWFGPDDEPLALHDPDPVPATQPHLTADRLLDHLLDEESASLRHVERLGHRARHQQEVQPVQRRFRSTRSFRTVFAVTTKPRPSLPPDLVML
jgi:ABC-type amino acid transport substrate-binding protein